MVTFEAACDSVKRYWRTYAPDGVIDNSTDYGTQDYGTHWCIWYKAPKIGDTRCNAIMLMLVVEKGTGDMYCSPSRSQHRVDLANLDSIKHSYGRCTGRDLEKIDAEPDLPKPTVFVPALMRSLTDGQESVQIKGAIMMGRLTLGQLIDALEVQFPGIKSRLCDGNALRPGLAAVIDGQVSREGLAAEVRDDSEVHFIPAIGGG